MYFLAKYKKKLIDDANNAEKTLESYNAIRKELLVISLVNNTENRMN